MRRSARTLLPVLLMQLLAAAPAAAEAPETQVEIAAAVADAARRVGLPAHWIGAVLRAESAGRPRAVSGRGALGLMQLMPPTWLELRARLALGLDPFNVRDNILAGAVYLRDMLDRFGAPGFLAAYNAGPGRYADYLAGRADLPAETVAYVARLAPQLELGQAPVTPHGVVPWTYSSLFPQPREGRPPSTGPTPSQTSADDEEEAP